ncbi:MAG: TIGR03960 family B12-binding radical SAM protein [Candidatus Marinimicrobia bacterium]|nr:TIGR03960 family B12-binding radical SAM protein [Candidatus Neomarinimicrobiota bacterium]
MEKIAHKLLRLLPQVEKPGRYIGNEINIKNTSWEDAECRTCLFYPDTYEVGMPFIGFQILYHILNERPHLLADRCFSPWPDMEALLRENGIPLYGLESKRPLKDFDIIGFTLQYEMTYTNILNALDISGIPLHAGERGDGDPLIFAGGSCAFNPEPLADFIDVFIIGDAEEILPGLCDIVREHKEHGSSRDELLKALDLPDSGVYVPSRYNREKEGPVNAAKITELKKEYYPVRPVIPLIEITQNRFALEIQRGCGAGCRFCHAGMIYRPVRERDPEDLIRQAQKTLEHSGYEEMSLLSLSTSDYSALGELTAGILPYCREHSVAISFPSLRIDSLNAGILDAASGPRRSGLTFAPEAGTQRLRNIINKNITEEEILSSVALALGKGWRTLKFYFMLGLPFETDADLQGIVDLIRHIHKMIREYKHTQINVTLSSFIPKPHTPFQWTEHVPPEEISRRIYFIRDRLHLPGVKIMHRDPQFSVYESLFSRGGREFGNVLYDAWSNGARFDAWSEMFRRDAWDRAIKKNGINTETAIAGRSFDEPLPWDFIDTGIDKEFLKEEMRKAESAVPTPDCRKRCTRCGLCGPEINMRFAKKSNCLNERAEKEEKIDNSEQLQSYYTLRIFFEKKGMLRYITHHDLQRIMQRVCNILNWPVRYSRGFHRRPRIAAGYPIPLGYEARNEAMDILLNEEVENPGESLNKILPEGMHVHKADIRHGKRPSIMAATCELHYVFHFEENLHVLRIRDRLEQAFAQDHCMVERKGKNSTKKIDLKALIKYWDVEENMMEVCYKVKNGKTGRPDEFLGLAFDEIIPYFTGERKHITIKE